MKNEKYRIREICGDWALDIPFPGSIVTIFFNSRSNAELVKEIMVHEDAHPGEAIPFKTDHFVEAEARAEKAERERDAAISDLTYIARTYPVDLCDDLVCQYCKHYQNVNTGCPGWTENDCFEWRGQKEE